MPGPLVLSRPITRRPVDAVIYVHLLDDREAVDAFSPNLVHTVLERSYELAADAQVMDRVR